MKYLWRSVIGLLLSMAQFGCSGSLQPVASNEATPGYFRVNSSGTSTFLHIGSAVQWNQSYAVSTAHIPSLSDVVHRCSTGCDLVFIRRAADSPPPIWRPAITGEVLETVGQSPLFITVKGTGTSKPQRVHVKGDNTYYALSDAPVVEGMSGGPIYGVDDAVVGITVGVYHPPLPMPTANIDNLTVYVPYEIIQREWKYFSSKRK
ncbi:hypothetical protein ACV1EC_22645 [Aeromonas hydrophila]